MAQRRTRDRSQAPGTGRSYFTEEETEARELKWPALGHQLASGSLLPCNPYCPCHPDMTGPVRGQCLDLGTPFSEKEPRGGVILGEVSRCQQFEG